MHQANATIAVINLKPVPVARSLPPVTTHGDRPKADMHFRHASGSSHKYPLLAVFNRP